jgi:hypothetical protein
MTALEFLATLGSDGTVRVPNHVAERLKDVPEFRVLLLVPDSTETAEEEDEAWDRLTESQFFRGYAESDAIYDDIQSGDDGSD